MKIEYVARGYSPDDQVRRYTEDKLQKVLKFLEEPVEVQVTFETEKHHAIADFQVSHRFGSLQARGLPGRAPVVQRALDLRVGGRDSGDDGGVHDAGQVRSEVGKLPSHRQGVLIGFVRRGGRTAERGQRSSRCPSLRLATVSPTRPITTRYTTGTRSSTPTSPVVSPRSSATPW